MSVVDKLAGKITALPTFMGVLFITASLGLIGCGDSNDAAQSSSVDAREVKKQAEPQAPSLEQKLTSKSENVTETQAPKPTAVSKPRPAPIDNNETSAVSRITGKGTYATCIGCHGTLGEGAIGPKLAGQTAEEIVSKLKAYRSGEQIGPMTALMTPISISLTDEEIDVLAEYIITF